MAETPVSNLYEWLQEVRLRPSMYVRDWSLDELGILCHGYSVALNIHGIDEFGSRFRNEFQEYLLTRYRWSMCKGWAHGIRDRSRSPEEAFHRFYELLDEFKQHQGMT